MHTQISSFYPNMNRIHQISIMIITKTIISSKYCNDLYSVLLVGFSWPLPIIAFVRQMCILFPFLLLLYIFFI